MIHDKFQAVNLVGRPGDLDDYHFITDEWEDIFLDFVFLNLVTTEKTVGSFGHVFLIVPNFWIGTRCRSARPVPEVFPHPVREVGGLVRPLHLGHRGQLLHPFLAVRNSWKEKICSLACEQRSRSGVVDQGDCSGASRL